MRHIITGPASPTAHIAVNKSRLKVYETSGELSKYYLNSNQEFEIELFNPTSEVILAKIKLNNKYISQSGLVLKPGQRVFLDRYIDVAKKFLFETYEVESSDEAIQAIQQNGDFVVEFFKERKRIPIQTTTYYPQQITYGGSFGGPTHTDYYYGTGSLGSGSVGITNTSTLASFNATNNSYFSNSSVTNGDAFLSFSSSDSAENYKSLKKSAPLKRSVLRETKSIETGRVEEGSKSSQSFGVSTKEFDYFAFHTVSAKLIPFSQKPVESRDLKRYCTNCGSGLGRTHKFCASCGTKA